MELSFTAVDSADWVQLDSIKVMNRTQGGDTVLYYPDTILILDYQVGVPEEGIDKEGFRVNQNFPNPFTDRTTISMYVPEKDMVSMTVTDIHGRMILKADRILEKGTHFFSLVPGSGGLILLTAQWKENISSIKMLHLYGNGNKPASLEYLGISEQTPVLKVGKGLPGGFSFILGDTLLYIGYTDTLQSGILDSPEDSRAYTLQFATNIPCLGTPTVEYEGQIYNTIQVFSQCWLKENLNLGTMRLGWFEQTDDGIIEKYCFNNSPDSCDKYGGLYQWDEMMQYTTLQGVQGICPPGWHLPTDEEWKLLEGAVDSHFGIGDSEWDLTGGRGHDAGYRLRSAEGWFNNLAGNDLFGVSLLPGGYRKYDGSFHGAYYNGEWWTTTEVSSDISWRRRVNYSDTVMFRNNNSFKEYGFGVRCIKDE
jgi:uncharacterized protein (TIGR02145 family)